MVSGSKVSMKNLQFLDETGWKPLPDWCKAYTDLGCELVSYPRTNAKLRVALAIPILDFAATFTAIGVVLASANRPADDHNYSKYIREQPIGKSVVYRVNNRKYKGTIENFIERNGEMYVEIRTGRLETRQLNLSKDASKIIITDKDFRLRDYQHGGKVASTSVFIDGLVVDPEAFVTQTQLHCLIVTRISKFRDEVEAINLGLEINGEMVHGSAQEVLRVRQFLGSNQAYRCQVTAVSGSVEDEVPLESAHPPIVIFAGSNSYLKHYSRWPNSHQLVLLDRTERTFQDAVDNLNESYGRRVESSVPSHRFSIPPGVDGMIFEEGLQ